VTQGLASDVIENYMFTSKYMYTHMRETGLKEEEKKLQQHEEGIKKREEELRIWEQQLKIRKKK
jgi:hypothetical protein